MTDLEVSVETDATLGNLRTFRGDGRRACRDTANGRRTS
jgi:hypothetical protein